VLGLIDLLDDVKAHYALHALAVRMCGGDDKARAEFATAVASQVTSQRPSAVRKYLIEQLQVAGGREVVEPLGKALLDPELCDAAARALAAIGDGASQALLAALPRVKGAGRLSVIKKLAVLRAAEAADVFVAALSDGDANVRIAAAWGIARMGAASAADALIKCADAHEGWERINETDACMALADGLGAAGKKKEAAAILTHLVKTRTDRAELHVRDAAQRALAGLGRTE
jgi:HEAT repeat protein